MRRRGALWRTVEHRRSTVAAQTESDITMKISLIGVPMDLGADRSGVDMGPSAIRYAGIAEKLGALGHQVRILPEVPVPHPDTHTPGDSKLKYLEQIVAATNELAKRVEKVVASGALPVVLGGDNSISLGSIAGVAKAREPIGVLWLDAHGDFNTADTSPSGNIHGQILAALAGYGDERLVNAGGEGAKVAPEHIVIVGARNLDPGERALLHEAGVNVRTIADIDRRGMSDVAQEALALATAETNGVYVMLDMDVMDPSEAPGVGTPVPGGITYREAHLVMEMVAESGKLLGLDLRRGQSHPRPREQDSHPRDGIGALGGGQAHLLIYMRCVTALIAAHAFMPSIQAAQENTPAVDV